MREDTVQATTDEYKHYFDVTGNPQAAAMLVLAQSIKEKDYLTLYIHSHSDSDPIAIRLDGEVEAKITPPPSPVQTPTAKGRATIGPH